MFGPTRTDPWPDDLVVNGVRMGLVAPNEGGELLSEKTQPFDNVAPTEYNINAFPLYAERTLPFRRMQLGMGSARQKDGPPERYNYAVNVDASLAGLMFKGPHFHQQDGGLATTGAYRDHVMGNDNGTEREFAAIGGYVYVRQNDTPTGWVVSNNCGNKVMQLARFQSHGTGTNLDAVYAVTATGVLWRYAQHTALPAVMTWQSVTLTTVTPSGFLPTAIEVIDDDLFGIAGNELRSCSANPFDPLSWSGPIFVGDASAGPTWLRALHGQLYVFKTNGLFTITGVGGPAAGLKVTDLMNEIRQQRSPLNGVGASTGRDALWFTVADQMYKLVTSGDVGGTAEIAQVGLGVLMENESPVRGHHVGMAFHGLWFGYFVVVNGTDSYLCKWGSWTNPDEQNPLNYRFSEVPHGALYKWTGKIATGIFITNPPVGTTNQRLYVGFSNGTMEYCLLPVGSPAPYLEGSGCEFTLNPGEIHFPRVNADWPGDNKIWRAVTPFGRHLDFDNRVKAFYRTERATGYIPLPPDPMPPPSDPSLSPFMGSSGVRTYFPMGTGSLEIEMYGFLFNKTTATTPLVEGFGLHYSVLPELVLEYTGAIDARHFRVRRDGTVDQRDPNQYRQTVLAALQSMRPATVQLPDGQTRTLFFFRYTEELPTKWRRYGIEHLLPFKAIEFKLHESAAGSHAHLMKYRHFELRQYTHAGLMNL